MGYQLELGLHQGTMMSRGFHKVETHFDSSEPLLTVDDCRRCAMAWKANYDYIGVTMWYATAIAPNGDRCQIYSGPSYR